MRGVEPQDWRSTLAAMRDDGFEFLDFLAAIDREDHVEVVVHVLDQTTGSHELLGTRLPADDASLDSITPIFAAAGWHERETAEMFGVTFVGHPDPGPLLLRSTLGAPPLRKSTVLSARAVLPWPGAADQGGGSPSPSRRRQRPPGVPGGWLREGDA